MNIVSDRPVSKDMLYTILLSTLRVQGYAAVEGDGFVKIVPEAEAKTSASPTGEAAVRVPGDRIVTQVFLLQNESRRAAGAGAAPAGDGQQLHRRLSEQQRDRHHRLRGERAAHPAHHPARSTCPPAPTCRSCGCRTPRRSTSRRCCSASCPRPWRRRTRPARRPRPRSRSTTRTNSLIVRADNPALMNRIKTLALGLDTPGAGNGNIYVVFLRNAEATRIAETLRGLLSGRRDRRAPRPPTTTPSGSTATQTTASTTTGSGAPRSAARRAQLDHPGLSADQLDHHHRARSRCTARCAR